MHDYMVAVSVTFRVQADDEDLARQLVDQVFEQAPQHDVDAFPDEPGATGWRWTFRDIYERDEI